MELHQILENLIKANNAINEKINVLIADMKGLSDYFVSMGDFTETMQNILLDAMDKTSLTTQLTAETLKRAGDFYKSTVSNKYSHQNIMQEWFYDIVIDVIEMYSDKDKEYIAFWLNIKFKDATDKNNGVIPANFSYENRVEFGEKLFKSAIDELGMQEEGRFILQTLFIPFISLQYFKPMTEYPYIEQWKSYIKD